MKTAFDISEVIAPIIKNNNLTSNISHMFADTPAIHTLRDDD